MRNKHAHRHFASSLVVALLLAACAFLVGGLVLLGVILHDLDLVLDGRRENQLRVLAFADAVVEDLGGLECGLEEAGVLSGLEADAELLETGLLLGEVVGDPQEGLVVVLHWHELAEGLLLEDEVGHGLQRLLLAHHEADLARLLVAEELGVARPTLLPLLISPPVELRSESEDALLGLLAGDLLDLGQLDLCGMSWLSSYLLGLVFGVMVVDIVGGLLGGCWLVCHI